MVDELSWRLLAAGIPVLRVNLRGGTLHPQFLGAVYVWWRTSAMNSQRQIAQNVLKAYLGPQTGRKVLTGQIRRGSGEAIAAVLWSSDLRHFTQMYDQLSGESVIGMLNDLFDLQARAIARHDGEILKFIGDGLLAIFPVACPGEAARTAANALAGGAGSARRAAGASR
jgi:adenylate cyclase